MKFFLISSFIILLSVEYLGMPYFLFSMFIYAFSLPRLVSLSPDHWTTRELHIMILISNSQNISDSEHLYLYLVAICMSSKQKYLLKFFALCFVENGFLGILFSF